MQESPRMSEDFFKKLLRSDTRLYYISKELNEELYLHFQGFHRIENLEPFIELKALYLEFNAIEIIEGLETLSKLRSLYLQENCLTQIEGLGALAELDSLSLSNNFIETVSGLEANLKLTTLLIQGNRIGVNGLFDLQGLLGLPNLAVLDISNNKIEDEGVLPEVLERLPGLRVLHFNGNPVCHRITPYRKTLVSRLTCLKFLDDRPVFDEDRRFAAAFMRGGLIAEREERKLWNIEKEAERVRQHEDFREMINEARGPSSAQLQSNSLMHSLSTEPSIEITEDFPPLLASFSSID